MNSYSEILNAVVQHRCVALPCGEQGRRPQDRLPPRHAILPSTEAHFSVLLQGWLASEVAPQYQVTQRENWADVAVVCMDIAFKTVCAQLNDQYATDCGDFKGLVRTGVLDAEIRGGPLPLQWTPENPCVAGYVRKAEADFERKRESYSAYERLRAVDEYLSKMFSEMEWKAQDETSYRCSRLAKYDGGSSLIGYLCTGMTLELTAKEGRIHCECDFLFPRSARIVFKDSCWCLHHLHYLPKAGRNVGKKAGRDGIKPRSVRAYSSVRAYYPLSREDADFARLKSEAANGQNEFEFFSLSSCPECCKPKEVPAWRSKWVIPQPVDEFWNLAVKHVRDKLADERAARTERNRGPYLELWEAATEAICSNASRVVDWASEKCRRLRDPAARLPDLDVPKLRIGRLRRQTFGESVEINLEAICDKFAKDHGADVLGNVLSYISLSGGDHV